MKLTYLAKLIHSYVANEETAQKIADKIKEVGYIKESELIYHGYTKITRLTKIINTIKTDDGMLSIKTLIDILNTELIKGVKNNDRSKNT